MHQAYETGRLCPVVFFQDPMSTLSYFFLRVTCPRRHYACGEMTGPFFKSCLFFAMTAVACEVDFYSKQQLRPCWSSS